jgi:hypothetical protein
MKEITSSEARIILKINLNPFKCKTPQIIFVNGKCYFD